MTRAGTLDYMAPEVLVCPDKKFPEQNKDNLSIAYSRQVGFTVGPFLALVEVVEYVGEVL